MRLNHVVSSNKEEDYLSKFFKVSHCGGYETNVIEANNEYEAVGFFLLKVIKGEFYIEELDEIVELPSEHKVEVSCIGFPVYKTLKELAEEKESGQNPRLIVDLVD